MPPPQQLTPEQRAQKAEAGRKGMASRYAKRDAERAKESNRRGDLPRDRPATIGDYDRVLGKPVSWAEAIKREQLQAQLDDAEKRRGNLVSRQESEEASRIVFAAFSRLGSQMPVLVVTELGERLPVDIRAVVSQAVEAAWQRVMDDVGKTSRSTAEGDAPAPATDTLTA